MPHDKSGAALVEGDQVTLVGKVKSVTENEEACNAQVEVQDMYGPGQHSVVAVNTKACAKVAAILMAAVLLVPMAGGCSLAKGPADMMSAAAEAGKQVAKKIADEGVLEQWFVNLDGHVQDPGIESYVQITAAAGVRAKGVNGNIVSNVGGDATRLPPGVREELIKQLSGPISDQQRATILELLGWNRTAAPPGGGT